MDTPPWLENPPATIPRELVQVIGRMVAKIPAHRFEDALAVDAALAPFTCTASTPMTDSTPACATTTRRHTRSLFRQISLACGLVGTVSLLAFARGESRQNVSQAVKRSPNATRELHPRPAERVISTVANKTAWIAQPTDLPAEATLGRHPSHVATFPAQTNDAVPVIIPHRNSTGHSTRTIWDSR